MLIMNSNTYVYIYSKLKNIVYWIKKIAVKTEKISYKIYIFSFNDNWIMRISEDNL